MSWQDGLMLGTTNPYFLPTPEMFFSLINFLKNHNIVQADYPYPKDIKPLRVIEIEHFPKNYLPPLPSQWTEKTIKFHNALFWVTEADLDTEKGYVEVYKDPAGLREPFEPIPQNGDLPHDISFEQIHLLDPYLSQHYYFDLRLPVSPKLIDEMAELDYCVNGPFLSLRYGFHYENNSIISLENQDDYFRLFSYAPTALDKKGSLLLAYAGCFSITVYTHRGLFGDTGYYNFKAPGEICTLEEGVTRFKNLSKLFYQELRVGMEEIFQQPVDLFLCASY